MNSLLFRHKYFIFSTYCWVVPQSWNHALHDQLTIILTQHNAALIKALGASDPRLNIEVCRPDIPKTLPPGPLFCFVDWMLPDLSGLELCSRLRDSDNTRHGHITMILETRDDQLQRRALRAGSDDYIIGPLTEDHILDKTRSQVNRTAVSALPAKLFHGDLTVDLLAFRVKYKDRNVDMPANEFRLLTNFIENSDKLLTRKNLIEMLGKDSQAMDDRNVNVWVGRLRRSLIASGVPDPIRTVRSLGYVMDSF